MKKNYEKPKIDFILFETNDVITTSCTCVNNVDHYHYVGNVLYFHNENVFEATNTTPVIKVGFCPEHGAIYSLKN